jgi:hypothetical protein
MLTGLCQHMCPCIWNAVQARGDLNPPQGTKPMPPFEKWSFKKRNFLQYLTDLLHVRQLITVWPLDQFRLCEPSTVRQILC